MTAATTASPAPGQTIETVTLKIDGVPTTVPKGTNILEAARSIGIDISYFCYHPGLSSPAVCRQCLVDVKGMPKLVPSCYTPVAENMEVATSTPRVLDVRRQMLEFTLVNHPVDCPICDKAGECTLQALYQDWDHDHSRITQNKVHKPKAVDLGPTIVLDAERCILCTRCIRVCDEVARTHQLEMKNRGDHEEISVAPGQRLDNPYSLNTVDVCPVGALTSKDFRFRMRAWELLTTPSVCTGCATGCNLEVHHAQGEIWRLVPRHNAAVNRYWMCDEGRFTYREVQGEDRVVGALLSGDPAPLQGAVEFAAARLQAAREAGTLGIVFGAQASNEDLFLLRKVADALGVDGKRQFIAGRPPVPARQDDILRDADVNPNTAGARLMARGAGDVAALEQALKGGKLKALWVVGEDLPLSAQALSALGSVDVVVQAVRWGALTEAARVVLPAAAWSEVDATITNRQGRAQRLRRALDPRGGARAHWELIAAIAQKMGVVLPALGDRPAAATPRAIFNAMRAEVPELAGAEWGKPVPLQQLRFAGSRG